MSTGLSFQEEQQLVKELQSTLCVQQAYRCREVMWEELPGISPALATHDVKTLRHYVSLMGAAGFFADYKENDTAFSFREYLPGVYGRQSSLSPPPDLKAVLMGTLWSIALMAVLWAAVQFLF